MIPLLPFFEIFHSSCSSKSPNCSLVIRSPPSPSPSRTSVPCTARHFSGGVSDLYERQPTRELPSKSSFQPSAFSFGVSDGEVWALIAASESTRIEHSAKVRDMKEL